MKEYAYINKTGSSRWDQPCTVSVQIHDLDQAHYLATALQEISMISGIGGDVSITLNACGEDKDTYFL